MLSAMNNNKIIIVTGAGSGIGLALAKAYVAKGHQVIAADINASRLEQAASHLGANFIPQVLDVSQYEAWEALVENIQRDYGRLDLLFNNAGIMSSGEFDRLSLDSWQAMININLMGVIYGSRAAYSLMKQQGFGCIVNTASTAGVTPVLFSTSYVTTKHGVVGFSNSLREEAKPHGIKVVVVMPGLIDTGIFDAAIDDGNKSSRYMADNTPVGKISPERAAEYILDGLEKNRQQIIFPLVNKVIIHLYRFFPRLMTRLIVNNQQHSA